jgi:D-glycero-D-manno-heptose 1,7-bisphosphate phosphatase
MGSGDPGGYRAIFLDRDGVINRNVRNPATGEDESPLTVEGFSLLPGVMPALRSLRTAGYQLFLVSNQPNHAKGKASLATLDAIHYKFLSHLMWERIEFEAASAASRCLIFCSRPSAASLWTCAAHGWSATG